jgi:uncharacterized protein (DUF2237 family)
MSKRDESGKTKPCNICICQSCADLPEFEHKEMLEHLKAVHGLDLKTTKFTRTMIMHLDGDRWYEWQWQWTENKPDGVRFQQLVRELRSPSDMMYR